jgi:hypothetical protein
MNCVWFGGDNTAPSTSATQYNYLVPCFTSSWNATELARSVPLSEDITITKLTVYLDTAPGVGKQFTFSVRDDGVTTAASVVISDAEVTDTWTGSLSVSALSVMSMESVPLNTPTASTNNHWIIEYTTVGQHFLMIGGSGQTASNSAANYHNPNGCNSTAWFATATDPEIVVPTDATITKLTVTLDGTPGVGKDYTVSVRANNTTDNLSTTVSDAETIDSATGSIDIVPGDTLVMKSVPTSTPTVRRISWCMTIVPDVNGEIIYGFGSAAAPSATVTNYEQLLNVGNNAWNGTENTRYGKPPAVDFKKLYVKLATDPSPGNRTFTLMDSASPTALTANVAAGSTTGNDTTHTVTHSGGGNTGTWRSTVASSPAATAGVHIGYVMAIAQPAGGTTYPGYYGDEGWF